MLGLCVGDREACADCQCGERIDPIAASAPVRKLLFVEALGHTRVPFAGYWPDHRAGVELATIDAHRAAEAAADLERRLDDGVPRQARRDRFEIGDFAGRAAAGHSVPPRSVTGGCARSSILCGQEALPPPFSPFTSNGPALRDNPVYRAAEPARRWAAIAASILPGNSPRDGTIRVQKSTRLLISKVLNALSPRHKSACGRYIA